MGKTASSILVGHGAFPLGSNTQTTYPDFLLFARLQTYQNLEDIDPALVSGYGDCLGLYVRIPQPLPAPGEEGPAEDRAWDVRGAGMGAAEGKRGAAPRAWAKPWRHWGRWGTAVMLVRARRRATAANVLLLLRRANHRVCTCQLPLLLPPSLPAADVSLQHVRGAAGVCQRQLPPAGARLPGAGGLD